MIAKLKGIIDEVSSEAVIIDVSGVCYYLTCSTRTLSQLPAVGMYCILYTEMIVREDAVTLFGFQDSRERQWFRLLTTVQGVGKRVALSLLSLTDNQGLARAIASQDKAFIAQAEGVGPKLAARLVTELKDKVEKMHLELGNNIYHVFNSITVVPKIADDAVAALIALGYKNFEASTVISNILGENPNIDNVQELIRHGLAKLTRT